MSASPWDVIIIGAGAAGLFCAAQAGQRGMRVLLVDHSPRIAEKIRISGGGRCNFTNTTVGPNNYLSQNPHFCRSALSTYTPQDFIDLVKKHDIPFHEKHKGQLFCDRKSEDIIQLLLRECDEGHVTRWQPCTVSHIEHDPAGHYVMQSSRGTLMSRQVVIATGGLPVPKIGATDFGMKVAEQFGHTLVPPRPALVPLTFASHAWQPFVPLAGIALPVEVRTGEGKKATRSLEDLLFTHRGLSGPAILQISSYWQAGIPLTINLHPQQSIAALLKDAKSSSKRQLNNILPTIVPQRMASTWIDLRPEWQAIAQRPLPEVKDKDLEAISQHLNAWQITPQGDEGWAKAEVMLGGVSTQDLSSQTMESRRQPGLYFIGEVVDVTGWLGGYNFQWAWSSAAACARALKTES